MSLRPSKKGVQVKAVSLKKHVGNVICSTEPEIQIPQNNAEATVKSKPQTVPRARKYKSSQSYPSENEEKMNGQSPQMKQCVEPKVMIPYDTKPGMVPRAIEVERTKRYYMSMDIEELLREDGVDYSSDHQIVSGKLHGSARGTYYLQLPIEIFDDKEYEVYAPEVWIEKGTGEDGKVRIPAKALRVDQTSKVGVWEPCIVTSYDHSRDKFSLQWNETDIAQLPRVHILFNAEDPLNFSKRVAFAHQMRLWAENILKYNLFIDCMPTDELSQLDSEQVNRILASAINTKSLQQNALDTTSLLNEVNIDFTRTMNKIILDKHLGRSTISSSPFRTLKNLTDSLDVEAKENDLDRLGEAKSFQPELDLPPLDLPQKAAYFGVVFTDNHNFPEYFSNFSFNSFLTKPEIILVLQRCRIECNRVLGLRLFNCVPGKSQRVDEFEHHQNSNIQSLSNHLRDQWVITHRNDVHTILKQVGKGWYNMEERNREIYEVSKLKKLLAMINLFMQDTLRFMIEKSLREYTTFIQRACEARVNIDSPSHVNITWPAVNGHEDPKGLQRPPPLFVVDLKLSDEKKPLNLAQVEARKREIESWEPPEDEPDKKCDLKPIAIQQGYVLGFSKDPTLHIQVPIGLIQKGLEALQGIPQVERLVMNDLFWSHNPTLGTVQVSENWVQSLMKQCQNSLEHACKPLYEYLEAFDQYLQYLNLDIDAFVGQIEANAQENFNLREMEATISYHIQQIEAVESSIPTSINIGLFQVNCSSIKDMLINKHRAVAGRLQSFLVTQARTITNQVADEAMQISRELSKNPTNIEQLTALKQYMAKVPAKLEDMTNSINGMLELYNIVDSFHFRTSNEDFQSKWRCFAWPYTIHSQMEEVHKVLEEQQQEFLDKMHEEQAEFNETIKSLAQEVSNLANFTDFSRLEQIKKYVETLNEKLDRAETATQLFNSREDLFGEEITQYNKLNELRKEFEPYYTLWTIAYNWVHWQQEWVRGSFYKLNAESVESNTRSSFSSISKVARTFEGRGIEGCLAIARNIRHQIEEFLPHVPLVTALRNPGMMEWHWKELSTLVGQEIIPDEFFTLEKLLSYHLEDHMETVEKIGEKAGKEFQIRQTLDKMKNEWANTPLQIHPKESANTFLLHGADEIQALLDEHILMTQGMMFSSFNGPFKEEIEEWDRKLGLVSDVIDEWLQVQRSWLYLQPIFDSPDINKQLPTESKRFGTADKNWRQTMAQAKKTSLAIAFCPNEKLLEKFQESNKLLEMVSKGLSEYLETKRAVFARFYFLSNDELLEILSQTRDPTKVQPHLKKCFEGIKSVTFESDHSISMMHSSEGESVQFVEPVKTAGQNVEHWMNEVEKCMRKSIRHMMDKSIQDYANTLRTQWIQKWPGQCVLNGSQTWWTKEIEDAIRAEGTEGIRKYYEKQLAQLSDMVKLVRGPLDKLARFTLGALTVIDVHARDVTLKLINEGVSEVDDFWWISQMRYYWDKGDTDFDMFTVMVTSRYKYGYEYLGNSERLVITPLTDKCYLTLMGALQMILGGAPAGPAGTGKTETTKDLGKALAKHVVVFNCSDGLDYIAMGKFFKGLASAGSWACFDEFNRIDVEVLSVVAQQIITIQLAIQQGQKQIVFEESEIGIHEQFAVFITMNPGYAGRQELPDNLKALFRPVAMMVPDYAMIAEIMLLSYGYENARQCAQKIVNTFKLCSEQLSRQFHYDYGMRAVKSVITACGNLRRSEPDADELVLTLRALQDVNVPKFLAHDLPLFEGIISDLFPGKSRPNIDYGALMNCLKLCTEQRMLQPDPIFLNKCIQLYETICVRHGLMLVGPTGGGKSSNIGVLSDSLTMLKKHGIKGYSYEKIRKYQLNPKSITMGQLYGEFDANTHEWRDGILAGIIRQCARDTSPDRKWVIFNGPVDAIWIENMNTVLDDNKKLCLTSGEIIALSPEMTMMFEVEDLVVASPATVSRCGMVYMEPKTLGLDVLILSWMQHLPNSFTEDQFKILTNSLNCYLDPSIAFIRRFLKEPVPTVDNNLASSLLKILDCFFEPFYPKEGRDPRTAEDLQSLTEAIPALVVFALVWSVGATTDTHGRQRFDSYLRAELQNNRFSHPYPEEGLVYDYMFDLTENRWIGWMSTVKPYEHDSSASFADLIIPTLDSVRYTYLLNMFVVNRKATLMTGPTGTGKTVNINQYLMKEMHESFVPITLTFSARTTANQTQDIISAKLEKRRKGVYGPELGKTFVIYVDDLNMPQREEYFAQPPIELLRQIFDQSGWYDRATLQFWTLVDMIVIGSMGPPGGGRNPITPRFLRHFNVINYAELADESRKHIFSTILRNFARNFTVAVQEIVNNLVVSTIEIFNTIARELLPTPAKSHYTFNLRDLAKVFQGIMQADSRRVTTAEGFLRLWVHENRRVFCDRLVNTEDRAWFDAVMDAQLGKHFGRRSDEIIMSERLVYGNFMDPTADPKIYDEIRDMGSLVQGIEDYLETYNQETHSPMKLVMFLDAIEHVSRINRIITQPQGNALLLGVGGSGRQSLTRLATYMAGFDLFQIEVSKGYGQEQWRGDLRKVLMAAGLNCKPTVFLFVDTQIVFESQLEDLNNILNTGDVPNLYDQADIDEIMTACRRDCLAKRLPPTRLNVFAQYISRVRSNIHMVICMSPMGNAFRNRLRMFPSLVNCCTIDWFSEWPAQALTSVAHNKMTEDDLKLGDHLESIVDMFKLIHQSVETMSIEYLNTLRRYAYVTPTSYLELLSTYKSVLNEKRKKVGELRTRLQVGLDKMAKTEADVGAMQQQLKDLQPELERTQQEVEQMMEQIKKDKQGAEETKQAVQKEENEAQVKAAETKEIADDAQRDLDEALPALDEAVECLNQLEKKDLDEVRALTRPPEGVVLTMKTMCIMFSVKPVMKNDPENLGKKIKDYFEAARANLLNNASKLLADMMNYDKDNIPERVIREVTPFIEDPKFTPVEIAKASRACTAMCMWVRAMHKYHHVAQAVEPKKKRLAEAEAELEVTMKKLNDARERLRMVEERIAELERNYESAVAKKEQLSAEVQQCKDRLDRAHMLIGGLGGEKDRWAQTVASLNESYEMLIGDCVVASGTIAYQGPFTAEYRIRLCEQWREALKTKHLPHSANCNVLNTLGDPVQIRDWNIFGLPSDNLSLENGIMIAKARRWSLCIDPQGQANKFIKNMGKERAENDIETIKQSDKSFLRLLENGVRFGRWMLLENIGESLDAALEPILLQQKFKQGGSEMIKLGESTIPYNNSFRFFITTKLPNPHYPPELQVKVSLLNFTITPSGLEDQLLGKVVVQEMPELEERKNTLVISMAKMKKDKQDLENDILYMLSNAKGNILDNKELIETLAQSKATSEEINEKVREAEQTEKEIDESRENYRPVAHRGSLLFFCVSDLTNIDPMYQYSLVWFSDLFVQAIINADPSDDLITRIGNLNSYFLYSLYQNVCRSLFETHKLLFSLTLCVKIMQDENRIDSEEWRFFLSGLAPTPPPVEIENPDPTWITEKMWTDVQNASQLSILSGLSVDFKSNLKEWKRYFDSSETQVETLPGKWESSLNSLQKMCVLRSLRPDKVVESVQDFVSENLGRKFIEPPPFDLAQSFKDSSVTTPMIFVLSAGSDPNKDLLSFADEMRFSKKLKSISLGQGQDKYAERLIDEGLQKGTWVLLQNCHLYASWMSELERRCEEINPNEVHKDFRLWLTSMPSPAFPVAVLQNGIKMTMEPPKGLRANLKNAYYKLDDAKLCVTNKPLAFQKLLFGLTFFHALVQERRKFGPLGWNIPYEFNDSDLDISKKQLELFLNDYDEIPYRVLNFLVSYINYGGRVTDAIDLRTIDVILLDFFNPSILDDYYRFSPSGIYFVPPVDNEHPHKSFVDYIDNLPVNPAPEIFGMHDNANIACAQAETFSMLGTILALQPRSSAGSGRTRDEVIEEMAASIYAKLPPMFDVETVSMAYPVVYHESMNTVLVQEVIRYNELLEVMRDSLPELQKAIKGLVVMSAELENMGNSLFNNQVPSSWEAVAYPCLKPIGSWVQELLDRLSFIFNWIENGTPNVFWISGFFFPQAFLTGTLQNFARKYTLPIDTVAFGFDFLDEPWQQIDAPPTDGCFIYGLYLEGARWDMESHSLGDSRPKELYTEMPVIHMKPEQNRSPPVEKNYRAPVYKILSRRGTLSTTGHSTNFIMWIDIPSNSDTFCNNVGLVDSTTWIKAGVACFCSLRY